MQLFRMSFKSETRTRKLDWRCFPASHQKAMPEKSEAVLGISIPYFGQESQEELRVPQVLNQDPEIALEMLPSHQKALPEKSEMVLGI